MQIAPGCICKLKGFGLRLWVAVEPAHDHKGEPTRWRLTCKQVNSRGQCRFQKRVAGIQNIEVVHDAETYEVGSTITYKGREYLVLEDRGDEGVWLGTSEHTSPTRGGDLMGPRC